MKTVKTVETSKPKKLAKPVKKLKNAKTVMIIENDRVFSEHLEKIINLRPDFKVVARASDWSNDGKLLASQHRLDLIIMDILLDGDDGIKVLRHIRENFDFQPYIYIVTGLDTKAVRNMLDWVEADFFDFKPLDDDYIDEVLINISGEGSRPIKKELSREDLARRYDRTLADIIDDTLLEIGMKKDLSGYLCAKAVIYFILDNPVEPKKALRAVSAIFGKTRYSIDKNMRTSIGSCLATDLYLKLFGRLRESNMAFLCGLAAYVQRQLWENELKLNKSK